MTEPTRPAPADLVIDTSAIMALLLDEPTAALVEQALRRSRGPIISAATRLELAMVAASRSDDPLAGRDAALGVLDAADTVTVPVDEALADAAFDAWHRFDKGRHPARLNFGDVFSYATARRWDLPLLCVGDDFTRTDVTIAPLDARPN